MEQLELLELRVLSAQQEPRETLEQRDSLEPQGNREQLAPQE